MKTFHLIYKCKLIKNIFTGVVILHRIGAGFSRLTEHFGKQASIKNIDYSSLNIWFSVICNISQKFTSN